MHWLVRAAAAAAAVSLVVFACLAVTSAAQGYVYWDQQDYGPSGDVIGESIWRSNLDGQGGKSINRYVVSAASLTRSGRLLYFDDSHYTFRGIGRIAIDGSQLQTSDDSSFGFSPFMTGDFVSHDSGVGSGQLAADASHLYWIGTQPNGSDGYVEVIGRANLDGSNANRTFIMLPGFEGGGGNGGNSTIAVGGGFIYWSDPGGTQGNGGTPPATIGRASLDGSGVNESFITLPDGAYPGDLALDGAHVYWITHSVSSNVDTPTSIGRANLDGSGVEAAFIAPRGSGRIDGGLAVDNGHLYWGESVGYGGVIDRANLDGSGQTYIAVTSGSVIGLAVDGFDGSQVPLIGGEGNGGGGGAGHGGQGLKTRSTTVAIDGGTITTIVPKGCTRSGGKLLVKLTDHRSAARHERFVRLYRVDYTVGSGTRTSFKRAPFNALLEVPKRDRHTTVKLTVRAYLLLVHGKRSSTTIRLTVSTC